MPFYRCTVPADSLDFDKRQAVSRAFTDIHCGSTGAPRQFVHVAFFEDDESEWPTPYYIDGGNRAGRPQEVKDRLLADLQDAFRAIAGVPAEMVSGRITEGPASWSMEGGKVLPEPGEEGPEWRVGAAAD